MPRSLFTAQHPEIDLPTGADVLEGALEGLVRVNMALLRGGRFPALYQSGVRYRSEGKRQVWRHVGIVYARGWADCKNLAAWRVAELRLSGEDPTAIVVVRRTGPQMWHAIVERRGKVIEDPSRLLGMGQHNAG